MFSNHPQGDKPAKRVYPPERTRPALRGSVVRPVLPKVHRPLTRIGIDPADHPYVASMPQNFSQLPRPFFVCAQSQTRALCVFGGIRMPLCPVKSDTGQHGGDTGQMHSCRHIFSLDTSADSGARTSEKKMGGDIRCDPLSQKRAVLFMFAFGSE